MCLKNDIIRRIFSSNGILHLFENYCWLFDETLSSSNKAFVLTTIFDLMNKQPTAEATIKKPDLNVKCPMSGRTLRVKKLTPVIFTKITGSCSDDVDKKARIY